MLPHIGGNFLGLVCSTAYREPIIRLGMTGVQNPEISWHVMAVMLPISHWRCAKHTFNFVQQEVVHEA